MRDEPTATRERPGGAGGETNAGDAGTAPPSIPGYRILSEISRGSFGAVYRALQESLDRVVALKVIDEHPGSGFDLDGLLMEAQCLARISHPAVLPVYDSGRHGVRVYMASEYVEGGTLGEEIRRDGALSPDRFYEVARSLAGGLAAAHAAGILHRDLKPSNVLVRASGEPLIGDFGLARLGGADRDPAEGYLVGTPAYMAPEIILGQPATVATDLYAMSAMFYIMLTGRLPFEQVDKYSLLGAHLREEPLDPRSRAPGIPSHLSRIVLKGLQKHPDQRWKSARSLMDHLSTSEARASDPGALAAPTPRITARVRHSKRLVTKRLTARSMSLRADPALGGASRRLSIAGDASVLTFLMAVIAGLVAGLLGFLNS